MTLMKCFLSSRAGFHVVIGRPQDEPFRTAGAKLLGLIRPLWGMGLLLLETIKWRADRMTEHEACGGCANLICKFCNWGSLSMAAFG